MFIAMFTLESAYLGTPKHMSRRSSSGGTASLTSFHISNIWSIIYDAALANCWTNMFRMTSTILSITM